MGPAASHTYLKHFETFTLTAAPLVGPLQLRTDVMDCHIDICAPEVLVDFRENFDYQQVRRDFVGGVLIDEEMGNKIFVHELTVRPC
jgi:hypothetical protein